MSTQFKYLFSPFRIKELTLKNRIVFNPHLTAYATEEGLPSERHAYYFAERAKGGAGLVIIESQCVNIEGIAFQTIKAWERKCIPGWKKIVDMTHNHGAKIISQIQHFGNFVQTVAHNALDLTSHVAVSASRIPDFAMREIPKEMEVEDIKKTVEDFATCARLAKEAGFDGVELGSYNHCGLHRMFHSPYSNRRKDEYGGSLENRARFGLETVDAIRKAVGDDYVFGIRLCLDELIDGGFTLEDGLQLARWLEETGQVDYINADIGVGSASVYTYLAPMAVPPGHAIYAVAAAKEAVKLPVIAFGRINDPVQAERILADGQADLIGMARPLIADPELPNKALEGRLEEIRACVACNQGCVARIYQVRPIICIHNPASGREKELGIGTLKPADIKKQVMVVGGGPAGLKAAEVAARRGHSVTLYEKEKELGGQVNLAIKAPLRDELGGVTRYLIQQVERLGVKIHLAVEVTPETVKAEKPDVVVIATGSTPLIPEVSGVDQKNVLTVRDVLRGAEVGEKVLLFDDDGHWVAAGTAEFLLDKGKKVDIVTTLPYVGMALDSANRIPLYQRLYQKGVTMTPHMNLKAISGNTVICSNAYTGEEKRFEGVDTVVLAAGGEANDGLYRSLKGKVKELYRVGDCVAPRRLEMAIYEGESVGRSV